MLTRIVFPWALALALSACSHSLPKAGPRVIYPKVHRGSVTTNYHGTEVADPYRWLERLQSPQTAAFVAAQNAVSVPFLAHLSKREALKTRFTALWTYERYGVPVQRQGRLFYRYNPGPLDQSRVLVSDLSGQKSRVLIDPNTFSTDHTASLSWFVPSPNGALVAYAVSDSGSDWRTWHILDVATGKALPELLHQTKFTSVSWTPDSASFYYSRYPLGPNGKADDSRQTRVFRHTVHTDQRQDPLIYAVTDHKERIPSATITDDGRFLVIAIVQGYDANDIRIQRLLPAPGPVVPLMDRWDARYELIGSRGDLLYFHTTLHAPNGRIIAVNANQPARQHWRELVPQGPAAIQSASLVGDRLVLSTLQDAHSVVSVFDLQTGQRQREVNLPGVGTARGFEGRAAHPTTFFGFQSFTNPGAVYRYNVATGAQQLFKATHVPADLSAYETRQVFFSSKDGTPIPMFIIQAKGLQPTGDHPTLLYGYGGFNISLTPTYRPRWIAWLELGGVVAIPNLRGGGEYGEAWHLAGTRTHKQNVFDDFHAAATWLYQHHVTRRDRLATLGFSNGGLLIGATLTQDPTHYGAAIAGVGVLDMLRYHTASANARMWSSDYGLSENADEFKALLAYSPVQNAPKGACLPPTLVTTADHDDRVSPWHSYKFAAALQRAQTCDNPILLRVETRAGHGAGKPTWMKVEAAADRWAFLAWALKIR